MPHAHTLRMTHIGLGGQQLDKVQVALEAASSRVHLLDLSSEFNAPAGPVRDCTGFLTGGLWPFATFLPFCCSRPAASSAQVLAWVYVWLWCWLFDLHSQLFDLHSWQPTLERLHC